MTSIGFRVLNDVQRPEKAVVKGFLDARPPTPNVADVMGRFGAVGNGVYPINGDDVYLIGTAFTVRTHPSDNLTVVEASRLLQPLYFLDGQPH